MSGADSAQLRTRLSWILSGNYSESFSIDLAKYVIDETIKHSMSEGKPLPVMSIIGKLLEIARNEGKGKRDFSETAEILK
ncbi:hypothetical protein [Vulcanisaeta distributa]|uniref:hypothetical protein n=1 Tax=Vulcanisaeta distributa TaxID=164451 RepID=UPI000A70072A|nr:hypothetical protein [Vulcanisaeta distributa]